MFQNNQSHTMEEGRYFEKIDLDSPEASRQTSMMGKMQVRANEKLYDGDNGQDSGEFDLASEEPKRKYCSKNWTIAMIGFGGILIATIIIIVIIGSNSSWWSPSASKHSSDPALQPELVPSWFLSH